VYSHRSGGDRHAATFLCTHLASRGYAVAALDHSETFVPELLRRGEETDAARDARARAAMAQRLLDLSFLIDTMLERGAFGPVDPARIGAVGHSFGGWTVLAAPDTDPRIAAIVAHAPAGGKPTPPGTLPAEVRYAWTRPIPTLFIVAENDAALPLDPMRELFARAPEPKRLVVLPDTDHLHFVDDVEQHHEALRAALAAGEFGFIAAAMRPMRELAHPAGVHAEICALTEAHFDGTLAFS
jgi:predicted dienelactone hydrolase